MIPPDELPRVDVADVYKQGRLAARLRRTPSGVVFAYEPDYLTAGKPPVATTLPLGADPVPAPAGALPPFFSGLLPEGRRLSVLRRIVKTSADDELALLLAVGRDTIGDVQVVPTGEPPERPEARVVVGAWDEVRFAELFAQSVDPTRDPDRIGLPGVQVKLSAQVIAFPVARGHGQFMLKLEPPEYPGVVTNEAFFLRAAARSGLAVADGEVVRDRDGEPGLLVRRFDRLVRDDGRVGALAQEDACQVLGRYPADKYAVTAEDVAAALQSVCRAGPVAAREVLRQLAFAYLTANGDAHAKNFSVQRLRGEWRVTPAYDVPSTHPYGDTTMALPLAGRRREDITRASFVALGRSAGLPERAVHLTLDELCDRVDDWIGDLDTLDYDDRRIHKLRRTIDDRRRKLG